jgi:general secretion pathway protein A
MDLLSYWQLRERPFESVWDARYFFRSRAHDEALHRLCYLASEQTMNVGLLTGEIGCGKTLTCAVFREQLDPTRYCVASFDHGQFDFPEIVTGLLDALGEPLALQADHFTRWKALAAALERLAAGGRHLIVIFDEAQDFALETFARLKALTNFNGGGRAPLTLVFAGHPELQSHMAEVPSLGQRIGLLFHLRPLDRVETDAYLDHRLRVAGNPTGQVFSEGARQRLFEVSGGIPREINRLAKLAIEYAWVAETQIIPAEAIEAIVSDDDKHFILARL